MRPAIEIIGGFIVIAAALGISYPVLRARSTTATLELLRSELAVEREARVALEARCREDTAELRGQVNVLSSAFADKLADTVAVRISEAIATALAAGGIIDRRHGG